MVYRGTLKKGYDVIVSRKNVLVKQQAQDSPPGQEGCRDR